MKIIFNSYNIFNSWGAFSIVFPEQEEYYAGSSMGTTDQYESCRLLFPNTITGGITKPDTTNYSFNQTIQTINGLSQHMKTHDISCSYGYFPGTVGAFYVKVKILSGSKFRFCCRCKKRKKYKKYKTCN